MKPDNWPHLTAQDDRDSCRRVNDVRTNNAQRSLGRLSIRKKKIKASRHVVSLGRYVSSLCGIESHCVERGNIGDGIRRRLSYGDLTLHCYSARGVIAQIQADNGPLARNQWHGLAEMLDGLGHLQCVQLKLVGGDIVVKRFETDYFGGGIRMTDRDLSPIELSLSQQRDHSSLEDDVGGVIGRTDLYEE
ncbi:hypothetical protein PTKU15_93270 [Paraburkholderia terrae]|nr:hypothetical protein PTKU15_93270 [Paraburkholderia terrae]